jgi:hypothetical protein
MLRDFTALIGLIGIAAAVGAKIWFALRGPAIAGQEAPPAPGRSARTRGRAHWHKTGCAAAQRRKLVDSRV